MVIRVVPRSVALYHGTQCFGHGKYPVRGYGHYIHTNGRQCAAFVPKGLVHGMLSIQWIDAWMDAWMNRPFAPKSDGTNRDETGAPSRFLIRLPVH